MQTLADLSILGVAALHIFFLVLEMFLWSSPVGRRFHGLEPDFARRTSKLAANQGLYNGFLAAGLILGMLFDQFAGNVSLFFLGCVIFAGVYGGITTSRTIFWVQALPGVIALVLVFLAQSTH